jgi:hypothetical protein
LSFIKAVFGNRGFEIVLSDLYHDGARIHDEMLSRDDIFIEDSLDQKDTDIFEKRMRGFPKKLRKPFDRA